MERIQGFAEQGNQRVITEGQTSVTRVQGSFPGATITVFLTGTTTLATIFSDNASTPLSNPFTSDVFGHWFFYVANGRYDIRIAGGGLAVPWTIGDVLVADPASGPTTVTSVTAGNAGIIVAPNTGAVVVTNPWDARPAGLQLQYLRLRPNTGNNTTWEMASLPYRLSSDYNFPAQSPGGNLVVGANVITLAPVPLGVNGTDTNHWLYIPGGTGTPEPVLITGGTAVSGAATGTVIVTCANTHSGAWTIQSATSGIQEAISASLNGGTVVIPIGNWPTFATITLTGNQVEIVGMGKASRVEYQFGTGDVFFFNGTGIGGSTGVRNAMRDLMVDTIIPRGATVGVRILGQIEFAAQNVMVINMNIGFQIEGETTTSVVRIIDCDIGGLTPVTGIGVWQLGGADIFIVTTVITGIYGEQPNAGIMVSYTTGTKILGCDVFATGSGLVINPGDGQRVWALESVANWYDAASPNDAMAIVPTGTGTVETCIFVGDWYSNAARNGIELGSLGLIDGITIADARIVFNVQDGIAYNGGVNVDLIGNRVSGNSALSPGTYHGMAVGAGAGGFHILGGTYGQSGAYPNTQGYGISITAGPSDNYSIANAKVRPNVTGSIGDGGTGLNKIIKDNFGLNNAIGLVPSAAIVALGLIPYDIFYITGTTTVITITGGWTARTIRLLKQDAGTITIGGGAGNVVGMRTLAIGDALTLTFDGTFWY